MSQQVEEVGQSKQPQGISVIEFVIVVLLAGIVLLVFRHVENKKHSERHPIAVEQFASAHNLTYSVDRGVGRWAVFFHCYEPSLTYDGFSDDYAAALEDAEKSVIEQGSVCREKEWSLQ